MTSLSPMPDFVARVTPLLRAATRVWMFMHTSPDPDAVGSQVAVAWWIRQLNPACAIQIGGADRPIDALLGVAAAVDPTWYCHVDPADVTYLPGDVVVLVDVAELARTSRKGGATLPADVPLVVIDHHVVAPTTPYQYVDTRYQSAAALVYDMLACAGVPLTRAVHAAIVMGVLGDSGYFRYFDARIEATLQLVQRFCADYGASAYYELVDELERNRPVAHVILQGAYLRNLVVTDTYAYTTLSLAEVVALNLPAETIQSINATKLITNIGTSQFVFSIKEEQPGRYRSSWRTCAGATTSVRAIVAPHGGGGHERAAGYAFAAASMADAVAHALDCVARTPTS